MIWLDCNRRSYIWIFGRTLREDVRLACAQTPPAIFRPTCAFSTVSERTKKIIYANIYRNTINDGDSQTSPLPIFPEGVETSVHRLGKFTLERNIVLDETKKCTKTDSQLPIDPYPRASLTALRLLVDDPNLRFTVYMKTHYFFHKIKNIQF